MTVWGDRRTAPEDRPDALDMSVAEAARVLGISRTLAYDLVGSRELPSFRMGGRIRIPRRGVERLTGACDGEDLGDGGAVGDGDGGHADPAPQAMSVTPASPVPPLPSPLRRTRPRPEPPEPTTQLTLFEPSPSPTPSAPTSPLQPSRP